MCAVGAQNTVLQAIHDVCPGDDGGQCQRADAIAAASPETVYLSDAFDREVSYGAVGNK
jgi:hypothetical protein